MLRGPFWWGNSLDPGRRVCQCRAMTSTATGRVITELFAGQGWTAEGEEMLGRSLGPRAPELLLEAPGWLGLDAGQVVLEARCRAATHAIGLVRRYGCRVLGVDLVGAWLPKARAHARRPGWPARWCLFKGTWRLCRWPMGPVTW